MAVAFGIAGALAFKVLSLPLPWMLGALFATTVASMAHAPVAVPPSVRPPMSAVLGVLIGSSFDREVLAGVLLWLPSIAAIPLYIVTVASLVILYLRKIVRFDPRTAFFCAPPAGLGEMVILGDRMGGDVRTISLVHALRILIVVFSVPMALFWIEGIAGTSRIATSAPPVGIVDGVMLLLCGIVGALAGVAARLPAAMLLGPMIVSALAHLLGLVEGVPPPVVVAFAQLMIGAYVGARFRGVDLVHLVRVAAVTVGVVAIMLVVSVAFAAAMSLATGLPLDLLVLAYAPGGIAEMGLIAYVLGADPTFVATHHIVRVTLVVTLAPPLFALYRRRLGLPP